TIQANPEPTVVPSNITGCGQATILATPGAYGTTCRIYSASSPGQTTGGTLITTGTSYNVTTIGTTYYYVSSYNATTGCEGNPTAVTVTVTASFTFTLTSTNVSCYGGSNGTAT